jgi:hydrogenase expression/formation protein HypE
MSIKKIPLDIKNGLVDMSHGAGGRASYQLIKEIFYKAFDNHFLKQGDDACVIDMGLGELSLNSNYRLVLTTDAHVVSPLFFPGGDIGCLSVNGTINDVAMSGAVPLYLTASFILEEGLQLVNLQKIVNSMADAARKANVHVVAGDTKVVEKGKGDGLFISTTGVGYVDRNVNISGRNAKNGDVVIVSGTLGDHGIAVLSQRESLSFGTQVVSDCAALHTLVTSMLKVAPEGIHVLRDPTRGGVGITLNEIAHQSNVGIVLQEDSLPIQPQVGAACELLGLDPLYVANEGKLIVICDPQVAQIVLRTMRAHPLGLNAQQIGVVVEDSNNFVCMTTKLGGQRMIDWLNAEQLPRIC